MTRTTSTAFFFLLILLVAPLASAETEEAAPEAMGTDQQAMMQAWYKAATPGEQHGEMAQHTGTWNATVKTWMEPGGEPMVSQGTFRRELMLGGRVLQENFEGAFAGQPFLGFSLSGYDNATGRWWTTWNDNMSTGVTVMWGEWNDKAGGVVYTGEVPDPMSGGMVKTKAIVRYPEAGKEVMEMFDLRSGEAVKTMEIMATRE